MTNERQSGLTLVDMVIAATIMVIIFGVAYPGLIVANNTITTSGKRDLMERAGDQLLKEVMREVRSGLVTDVAKIPNAPSVSVAMPRAGIPLDELSDNDAVPWTTDARTIRFRQTGLLREADEREDINHDGDQTDTYAVGLLDLVVSGEARPLLTRVNVILALPGFAGDMDGDGNDDPLFEIQDRNVTIHIFLVNRGDNGRLLTTSVLGAVHLRNQQQ